MSNMQFFKANNVTVNDVSRYLRENMREKTEIRFPFDGTLSGNSNELLTKILFVNYRDSTQIKNRDIIKLKEHIESVLSEKDYSIICKGILNDEYYAIVNRIAFGHGIHNKGTKVFNLTSFASKFCGNHNQKAPFWDNLVSDMIKYFGYKHQYRNYKEYVMAFEKLQKENGLEMYSLREIEMAMWSVAKKATVE